MRSGVKFKKHPALIFFCFFLKNNCFSKTLEYQVLGLYRPYIGVMGTFLPHFFLPFTPPYLCIRQPTRCTGAIVAEGISKTRQLAIHRQMMME